MVASFLAAAFQVKCAGHDHNVVGLVSQHFLPVNFPGLSTLDRQSFYASRQLDQLRGPLTSISQGIEPVDTKHLGGLLYVPQARLYPFNPTAEAFYQVIRPLRYIRRIAYVPDVLVDVLKASRSGGK